MAAGDKQSAVIKAMEKLLDVKSESVTFSWMINKHKKKHFQGCFRDIDSIFTSLGGDHEGSKVKKQTKLRPDCFFGGRHRFILEFDELQHFTHYKLKALKQYPERFRQGFNYEAYISWCNEYKEKAIKKGPSGYRKPVRDFTFNNGRSAQRAYLDCFRDFLPQLHGLNKTIRISEFEIKVDYNDEESLQNTINQILLERKVL